MGILLVCFVDNCVEVSQCIRVLLLLKVGKRNVIVQLSIEATDFDSVIELTQGSVVLLLLEIYAPFVYKG